MKTDLLQIDFLNRIWGLPSANYCVFYSFRKMLNSRLDVVEMFLERERPGERKEFIDSTVNSLQMISRAHENILQFSKVNRDDWRNYHEKMLKEYEWVVKTFNDMISDEYSFREIDYESPSKLMDKLHRNPDDWENLKKLASSMIEIYIIYLEHLKKISKLEGYSGKFPIGAVNTLTAEFKDLDEKIKKLLIPMGHSLESLDVKAGLFLLKRMEFILNMLNELKDEGSCMIGFIGVDVDITPRVLN